MKKNYPYLKDSTFLDYFDRERLKEEFVKITVLDFQEKPIQSIEGLVTSGSFNLNGQSSIRRTCSLTILADEENNDLTNLNSLFSINKKVQVEIGFVNNTVYYPKYPMIWYPMGIYVIITPNIQYSSSGATISLQLKDKMCLLNGECGGILPAAITFHEYDTVDERGAYVTMYPTIYQIIQELVNHWGGEQLSKIIISDVDLRLKQVMRWIGSAPLYIITEPGDSEIQYVATTDGSTLKNLPEGATYKIYDYGSDVGYVYTDFTYGGELVGEAGESVCTILDKIQAYLGNYEYFYDLDGNFIFQEIKNYMNTTQATVVLDQLDKEDYLIDTSRGKAVYVFDDSNLITAYTNAPQYGMIKNDFVVWGQRETAEGVTMACRYHLSIDQKPNLTDKEYEVFFYEDPDDHLTKAKCPIKFDTKSQFPSVGMEGVFYMDTSTNTIYKWDAYQKNNDGTYGGYESLDVPLETVVPTDWRTALYLEGTCAEPFGKESNYYYTELAAEWPKIYDIKKGCFFDETIRYPSDIDFFLDFIDSGAAVSEMNISNIGRRTETIVDNDVNCVFEPDVPDLVLLDNSADNLSKLREECQLQGQDYIQLDTNLYSMLATGGTHNSAYQVVRQMLTEYTSYNESINITTVPIFYLEPNTRITVRNTQSNIYGDYMIQSITIPLDISGTMTISCTRAIEKI